jgi:hypothetical protein
VYITCCAVKTTPGIDGETGDVPAGTLWIDNCVFVVDQIISM